MLYRLATPSSHLLRMTSAAITPGTQHIKVNKNVMTMEPQPLSTTAKGGNITAKMTLNKLMIFRFDVPLQQAATR